MLRSYNYIELSLKSNAMQKEKYVEHETYLINHVAKLKATEYSKIDFPTTCPVCGSKHLAVFFIKWGYTYYICNDCEHIFLNVSQEIIDDYDKYDELLDFRLSDEYQEDITEQRLIAWQDLLDWIRFRTYRYLNRNTNLNILDYGAKYRKRIELFKDSAIAKSYYLNGGILTKDNSIYNNVDIVVSMDYFNHIFDYTKFFNYLNKSLNVGGILFLGMKMGSGLDILLLKEHAKVFPLEHIALPSKKSLEIILNKFGFEILEYSTPGLTDIVNIKDNIKFIDKTNYFIHGLIKNNDIHILGEFQRFIQKSHMSSYAQIVARKVNNETD